MNYGYQLATYISQPMHALPALPAGALLGVKALQLAWRLAASLIRSPARWEIEQQMKQATSYE